MPRHFPRRCVAPRDMPVRRGVHYQLARPLFHKLVVPVARRAACGRAAAHRAAARKVIKCEDVDVHKSKLGVRLAVAGRCAHQLIIEYEVEAAMG